MFKKRIAVAGFMHESNTFNPLYADREAFASQSLTFGADLMDEWREAHHEVGGFLESLQTLGHDAVPVVMAWATPSGPVRDAVFDEVVGYLIEQVQQAQPDGLLLALHGAMVTEGQFDADGEILSRLRDVLGHEFPIVVTLDFHGNVSERLVAGADAVVAYQTYPHIDQRACGTKAAELLHLMLDGKIQPRLALANPPMIFNIMAQDTATEPMQSFMHQARRLEEREEILKVSVMGGFAYADVPQMGPSVIVVSDGDAELATTTADQLADQLWKAREQLARPLPDAATAVTQAKQADTRPVVLVDTGDNVGGGSAGDGTVLLVEILKQSVGNSVVCLYAPDEVGLCRNAGIGAAVAFAAGGKVDRLHGEPVQITGRVKVLHDGVYTEPQARHGGKRHNHMGPTAVVEMANNNLLVLNSLRHPPFSLGQLTCLGIQPQQMHILVVKAAVAYKAAYEPIAGTIIEVDTPGLTAVNPHRFEYRHIRRPLYPLK